jgi:hypothetical protein
VGEFGGDLTNAIAVEWSSSAEPPREAPAVQHRQLTDGGDHVHLAKQAVDQLRAVATVDQQLLRPDWCDAQAGVVAVTGTARPHLDNGPASPYARSVGYRYLLA